MGGGADAEYDNNIHSQSNNKSNSPTDIRNITHNTLTSQKDPPTFAHPTVPPLAPLEYLQSQRRGSITDPSLHTHGSGSNTSAANNSNASRPNSPYVFGDPMSHSTDHSIQQGHRGLHSQSYEGLQGQGIRLGPEGHSRVGGMPSNEPEQMTVEDRSRLQAHPQSDIPTGSKRKMSSDRSALAAASGDLIDSQLIGPGVNTDPDAPAPKRRGSTIDSPKIAQMSLEDRRNSVDGNVQEQWWGHERRDSETSSMFSRTSGGGGASGNGGGGGYNAGIAEDSRPTGMAFAWPAHAHPPEQAGNPVMQNEAHDQTMPGHLRSLDPNNPHPQLSMMSSIAFANDRRISGQDNLSQGEPSTGPSRALRSRSRPPSRQLRGTDQSNVSGPSSGDNTEEPSIAPSPDGLKGSRADSAGATPYSRSPELRVSHKLAERKRRKEMKDLFDELRDQLPADRGMKASKWEILSKAIDFVVQLKQSHQDMAREIDMLRHEMEVRGGVPPFGPGGPPHPVVYGQGALVPQQYPGGIPHQPPHPLSRPPSSQNVFPPGAGPVQQLQQQQPPPQNGSAEMHRTDGPSN